MVAAKKADFAGIGSELGVDPVIVRIMRNRGMTTIDEMRAFLNKYDCALTDPYLLPDMDKAVDIIRKKIADGMSIRVIGDYDVDGVTSTVILYKGIKALGGQVSYAIPNRITDGYGINESMIENAYENGVDTVITCDNGIAASSAIEKAKGYGMTVVVTDHHEVPYTEKDGKRIYVYPPADALMDPKIPDCGYPGPGICGAMVAYKFISVMRKACPDGEELISHGLMRELEELAGLGTVCDVMELVGENRTVVSNAIKHMNDSANIGIRALRKVCGIEDKPVNAHELGFITGPCINATGRLDSADMSVELLLSEDIKEAVIKATELKNLNDLRKGYTETGEKNALDYIRDNGIDKDRVMIVYLPDLHESLAGIVAGRIKERFYRPVIVFTDSEDGIKGSGRSIEAYNMYEELNKCRELYSKFGGHAMAAGLSLPSENLKIFKERLLNSCSLSDDDMTKKIMIDVPMPLYYVTEELTASLHLLEPFGTGNPKPVFATGGLRILSVRTMGKTGDMCRLNVADESGKRYELVMFNGYKKLKTEAEELYGDDGLTDSLIDIIYYPDINEYNGRRNLQFIVNECRFTRQDKGE